MCLVLIHLPWIPTDSMRLFIPKNSTNYYYVGFGRDTSAGRRGGSTRHRMTAGSDRGEDGIDRRVETDRMNRPRLTHGGRLYVASVLPAPETQNGPQSK